MIYRTLPPWHKVDPYGPAAQHQLMITNLRVRLLRRQPCPCQDKQPAAASLPTDHYAIYDFIVKGSCLCNGHADHCVPAGGFRLSQQKSSNMVSFEMFCVNEQSLQVLDTPHINLHSLSCCENLQRCCITLRALFCLHFCLFFVVRLGVKGLGFCSHHSLTVSLPSCVLVCADVSEVYSEDWILGHSCTYHYRDLRLWKTLIKVFSVML